jgi:hypothetical protein
MDSVEYGISSTASFAVKDVRVKLEDLKDKRSDGKPMLSSR